MLNPAKIPQVQLNLAEFRSSSGFTPQDAWQGAANAASGLTDRFYDFSSPGFMPRNQ